VGRAQCGEFPKHLRSRQRHPLSAVPVRFDRGSRHWYLASHGVCHKKWKESGFLEELMHRLVLIASVLVCIPSQSIFAQTPTGQINVTVTDSSGAVVPGVALKLSNENTGVEVNALTNDRGYYVFVQVQPGTYTLRAAMSGFKAAVVESFTVSVNQVLTQNFSLSVGQVTESVQVKAEAPLLQASTSELGTVISQKAVERIPLNGRNFTQLMLMTPGVTPVQTQSNANETTGTGGDPGIPGSKFVRPSVNGQWNRSNMFLMDGVLNVSRRNSYTILPSIDAIREFKVQSHNDKGEYGGVMGGIVNLVTKSGSNAIHGTLAEFLRNELFNARNPFTDIVLNPQTGEYRGPGQFRQNQFGATLGGPVYVPKLYDGANKTFFFFNYDGWRYRRARASLYRVPSTQELSGDFSGWTQWIYDPATTRTDPTDSRYMIRTAFSNNAIPAARIDPMMKSYIQTFFDTPNTTAANFNNVLNNRSTQSNANNFHIRLDHRLGDRTTLFGRYNILSTADLNPNTNKNGVLVNRPRRQLVLGWDQILRPTLILQTRASYTTQPYDGRPEKAVSFDDLVQAGWTTANRYGFPNGSISGMGSTGLGGDTFINELDHYYQWSEDLSWLRGNHQLKFGSLVYYNRRRTMNPNSSMSFGTDQTADPRQTGGTLSGIGLASALLGVPSGFSGQRERLAINMSTWAFYAQDEWRVTPSLTMNLSLRYEFIVGPHYLPPFASDFDYVTGDFLIGGGQMPPACSSSGVAPCIPGNGTLTSIPGGDHIRLSGRPSIYYPHYRNFGPRLGVAWRFAPRTVLRSGFGVVYDLFNSPSQEANNIQGGWPNSNKFNGTFNLLGNPLTTVQQAVNGKNNPLPDANPWQGTSNSFDPRKKPGYSVQYNVEVQQQVTDDFAVSLAYVGSVNRRMPFTYWINTSPTPGPGTATEVNARRPFSYMPYSPKYGTDLGESSYNALQFQLNRRFARGLTLLVAFTWSKTMDNGSSGWFGSENGSAGESAVQNSYDIKSAHAVTGYDVPKNLWAGGSWELPFGKGKRLLHSGLLAWVLGNWRADFIQEMRTGQAWNPRITGDLANVGKSNYLRPNLVGDPYLSHPTVQQWVNKAAFAIPTFSYGNLGRNVFRSASVLNTDLSFTKEIRPTERTTLEFRAEAFNLFNIMNYGVPNVNVNQSNFATISSLAGGEYPRQFQFGLKLMF